MTDEFATRPPDSPTPEPEPSAEDRALADLLDRYLDGLQRRDAASCSQVFEQNPEIVELLRCLHSLDSLAADPTPAQGMPAINSQMNPYVREIGTNSPLA